MWLEWELVLNILPELTRVLRSERRPQEGDHVRNSILRTRLKFQ